MGLENGDQGTLYFIICNIFTIFRTLRNTYKRLGTIQIGVQRGVKGCRRGVEEKG